MASVCVKEGVKTRRGPFDENLLAKHFSEEAVHAAHGIANAHCSLRVAVVAAERSDETVLFGMSERLPVLDGHLLRNLDRDRSRVGEKDARKGGKSLEKTAPEPDGRPVSEASEHHVRKDGRLLLYGLDELSVAVAVHGAPPGRCAVDEPAPVGQCERAPLCTGDALDGNRIDGRSVRMPEMAAVEFKVLLDRGTFGGEGREALKYTGEEFRSRHA